MDINEIKSLIDEQLKQAESEIVSVNDKNSLEEFRGKFLGKKSFLTQQFQLMKEVPVELKKDYGQLLSALRTNLNNLCDEKRDKLNENQLKEKLESEKIDITLPGDYSYKGSKHPFQAIVDQITDFFIGLGYDVADGPEVESEMNNFELMNIPKDHPSRDMQDSFSIDSETVLRSHTSSVQARVMKKMEGKGPVKVICPGKVYRRDNDATHSHQFGQVEGLVISEDVTFANLLETLKLLLKYLFGENREVRFRPSFFPFTEPSVEADISCFECQGKGCNLCKHTGWIEILGSGMVHPNVLRLNGYDDKKYKGFAFGIGIDRVAMLKYSIDDIKRFYTNDISFLNQFDKE